MTTDTFPKVATAQVKLGDATVTINGIAKGAGMIAPDMATMLSFVFTDAPIAAPALQAIVSAAVVDTLNAVTVDGDTSTSDTLIVFATGAAPGAPKIARANDPKLKDFRKAFEGVLANLAEQIARDGEGARKLVEIVVEGATSKTLGAAHRALDRQLAAGQDRARRRGRELGPRRDGGRQGGRAGRPRQIVDLVRRHARGAQGRARSGLRRDRRLELHEIAGNQPESVARNGKRPGPDPHMRPDQGIRRDQRRLSLLMRAAVLAAALACLLRSLRRNGFAAERRPDPDHRPRHRRGPA